MGVPYFFHFPGPFFQVCGSEINIVLLANAVIFCGLLFLVEKGVSVKGRLTSSSHDVCNICDGFQFYFYFLICSLYEESDKAEAKLGKFNRS